MRRKLQKDNKKVQKVPHQSNDLKSLGVKFQDMSQHLLMKKNFKIISLIQSRERNSIDKGRSNKCAKCKISLDSLLVNLVLSP